MMRQISRRAALRDFIAIAAAPMLGVPGIARAQAYPSRQVRIVVPFAAGGGTDILARLIAQQLSEQWNSSVLIENRPGGGTVIGANIVAHSPPDGYMLLFTANPHTSNPALLKEIPYDTLRDFSAVTMLVSAPLVLVVNPALPVNSVKELIAYAKAHPDDLSYASSGSGGPQHLAGELFKHMAGIRMMHVPYKGSAPALTDLLGNRVQVSFASLLATEPYRQAGKLRVLAVTSAKRVDGYAAIPTVAESGLPGFQYLTWYGVFAPAGTPKDVLARIQQSMANALNSPKIKESLAREGLQAIGNKPEQFDSFVKNEIATVRKLVAETGIKGE
jgi:tripartite-type tricarboxylate transporter receptor subunit TctC